MKPNLHLICCVTVFVFLAMTLTGRAASLLLNAVGGWNGFSIEATVKAGYRQAGGIPGVALEISKTANKFAFPVPDVLPPGGVFTYTVPGAVTATQLPDSGAAKDIATGSIDFTYTIGATPAINDTFNFDIMSTTSAMTAMVDFGSGPEAVDAFVEITLDLISFGPISGIGASITLPDMPTLTDPANETMAATLTAPGLSESLVPGDPGITVPLSLTGIESMNYVLNYGVVTPFGSDPTFSYSFDGEASAVPEPARLLLSLVGIAAIGLRRRRS